MSLLCMINDKHVPVYRILWVSAVPHFCGADDCQQEGQYEVRLEQNETIWARREERDAVLEALETWGKPGEPDDDRML